MKLKLKEGSLWPIEPICSVIEQRELIDIGAIGRSLLGRDLFMVCLLFGRD